MFFERKHPRYSSLAQASIAGAFSGEALVKDLSVTGCCLECTVFIDVEPEKQYLLSIRPEPASGIDEFALRAEARWIKAGNCGCEAGFRIVESPKGKFFQRYVDYLDYRAALG
jgi:hypothetical protein